MKTLNSLFGILALSALLAIQAGAQSFLTNGLLAYYPFNGNVEDASGNGNNGTNYGATFTQDRFGFTNGAIYFNNGAYVLTGFFPPLGSASRTFSGWFNVSSASSDMNMTFMFYGGTSTYAGDRFEPRIDNEFAVDCSYGSLVTANSYTDSKWHSFVVVVPTNSEVSTMLFYVDGILQTNTSSDYPDTLINTATNYPLQFGELWVANRSLTGALDDVRIYNRALSPNEVAQLYEFEAPPHTATATASVINGFVVGVTITDRGAGYTNTPSVSFTGGGGSGAQAVAVVSNGVVTAINVIATGSGYTNAPIVVIDPPAEPPPRAAIATASVVNDFVVGVTVTDGGSGYTNTPTVRIIGGGGSGAQAVAVVSNGVVTAINVITAGSGYTNAPIVAIDPPFIPNPVLGIEPASSLNFSDLVVGGSYQLQQFDSWYWTNQSASFTASQAAYAVSAGPGLYRLALNPVPAQSFATPQVVNGFVVGATITAGGSGYLTPPTVNIVGDVGSNATATASVSGGAVTGISIEDSGTGYTNLVTVEIAPPPATAIFPIVLPGLQINSSGLAPFENYQIQYKPSLGGAWGNWSGGLFSPTNTFDSQFILVTNSAGFFRLEYVP